MLGQLELVRVDASSLPQAGGNVDLWRPGAHTRQCHYLEILQVQVKCWYAHHQESAT